MAPIAQFDSTPYGVARRLPGRAALMDVGFGVADPALRAGDALTPVGG